jgi:hypothetical protein
MQMELGTRADRDRRAELRRVAEAYFRGLSQGDFEAIPFAENVEFRAPLAPGGSAIPLTGRKTVEEIWWKPLKGAIGSVEMLDCYVNEDATEVCARALVSVAGGKVVLRVADWFRVDAEGRIVAQENHFDPRDVTNPGWTTA